MLILLPHRPRKFPTGGGEAKKLPTLLIFTLLSFKKLGV